MSIDHQHACEEQVNWAMLYELQHDLLLMSSPEISHVIHDF